MIRVERVKELRDITADCSRLEEARVNETKHIFVKLTIVYDDEDGDTELSFFVPIRFVMNYTGYKGMELEDWLEEEYDSDDSQAIFDEAILKNMVFSPTIS